MFANNFPKIKVMIPRIRTGATYKKEFLASILALKTKISTF